MNDRLAGFIFALGFCVIVWAALFAVLLWVIR